MADFHRRGELEGSVGEFDTSAQGSGPANFKDSSFSSPVLYFHITDGSDPAAIWATALTFR